MRKWIAAAALLAASGVAAPAGAAEFEWRYYSVHPVAHDLGTILTNRFAEIKKRTNDRLAITFTFYGETPYKPAEGLNLIRDGLVELVEWLPSHTSGTYPILSGPELPFMAPAIVSTPELHAQVEKAWNSPFMAAREKEILDRHSATRVTRMFVDPLNIWFKEEFNSFDELEGMRIRAASTEQADLFSAVGATPITIPATELYTSLQRGLADATIIGTLSVKSFKLDEVVKSALLANLQVVSLGMIASKTALDALPEDVRTVFLEEMAAAQQEARAMYIDKEQSEIDDFTAAGIKFIRADAEMYKKLRDAASTEVWPKWAARAGEGADEFLKSLMAGQ